jgi:hypothetical protein
MAIQDRFLTEVAAESEYTREELAEAEQTIEQALQEGLLKHYKSSRVRGGTDYWILTEEQGETPGVWLALTTLDLTKALRDTGYDVERGKLAAVAIAHLDRFQDIGFTIGIPGSVARRVTDPMFYPIFVEYPEGWRDGEHHSLQRFQRLLGNFDLSSAEALDYWATTRMNQDAKDWAGVRGVDPEAVRKNVRQAHEKIEARREDESESPYEVNRLRTVDVEEVPDDDPHDPEKDMFYAPLDESESEEPDLSSVD